MTKMEKLIVSADPETKQLIEEIQDAIADTVEAKLKELLSDKISDIKIDSSKLNVDFSEIQNSQKLILEKLNKLESSKQEDNSSAELLQRISKEASSEILNNQKLILERLEKLEQPKTETLVPKTEAHVPNTEKVMRLRVVSDGDNSVESESSTGIFTFQLRSDLRKFLLIDNNGVIYGKANENSIRQGGIRKGSLNCFTSDPISLLGSALYGNSSIMIFSVNLNNMKYSIHYADN